MKPPPTQTLKHDSHFWPGLMSLCLLYAAFMAIPTSGESEIKNPELFIGMGVFGAILCLGMMLYKPSLKLSKDGFYFRYPFKSFSYQWTDVSNFRVTKRTKGQPFVSFSVGNKSDNKVRSFETSFGCKASELVELFEKYRTYALFDEAKNNDTELVKEEKANYAKFANQENLL